MNKPVTLQIDDKEIIFIGTAHVSKASAEEVKECIELYQPDCVCIELDEDRYETLQQPNKWKNTDILQVIKSNRAGYLLANIILSSYQRKIATKMDVSTGQEMMQGIESAKEIDAQIALVDRKIQTTFTRIWRKHSFWQKCKLIVLLISAIFDDEEISEEDLENLKQSETLEAALSEVSKQFPVVSDVLVHERDQVLAYKIKNAPGKRIVAILGAAHIPGVKEEIFKEQDIEELESVPQLSLFDKLKKWFIPFLLVVLVLSTFSLDSETGLSQIKSWILWNGTLSALGTLLVKGHLFSILTAFIMAPITSLSPLLAAGWFSGIMEAWIRKPKVSDFENISEDVTSFKGFFKNKVTHILLVVIAANLFSTLGTIIGGLDIVKSFLSTFF